MLTPTQGATKGGVTLKSVPGEDGFTRQALPRFNPGLAINRGEPCSSSEARAAAVQTQERNGTARPSPGVHRPGAETREGPSCQLCLSSTFTWGQQRDFTAGIRMNIFIGRGHRHVANKISWPLIIIRRLLSLKE